MAAKTDKTSHDYDPIEEAYGTAFDWGVSHEREKRTEPFAAKERRKGYAAAQADSAKKRREQNRRRDQDDKARRARQAVRTEELIASARRGACRSGGADAKRAQADAAREARATASRTTAGRTGVSPGRSAGTSFSAPDFRPPVFQGGQIDRTTSSRLIIMFIGMASLGVVYRDVFTGATPGKTVVQVNKDQTLTVPTHLRSFGGVFIAGTVALIVNEFSPVMGLLMGGLLVLDVGGSLVGRGSLTDKLGASFTGKLPSGPPPVPTHSPTLTPKPVGSPVPRN